MSPTRGIIWVYTYAVGVKPKYEKYDRFEKIYSFREKEGVEVPQEVEDFFGSEKPHSEMRMDIDHACSGDVKYNDGMLVYLDQLPKDAKQIRIFIS